MLCTILYVCPILASLCFYIDFTMHEYNKYAIRCYKAWLCSINKSWWVNENSRGRGVKPSFLSSCSHTLVGLAYCFVILRSTLAFGSFGINNWSVCMGAPSSVDMCTYLVAKLFNHAQMWYAWQEIIKGITPRTEWN